MSIAKIVDELPWYKKLEILRTIKGWNQKEVAEKCGVQKKIYWNWENGKFIPVERNRKKIAKVFGVPENEIFAGLYKE